jgi:hypothetical protein
MTVLLARRVLEAKRGEVLIPDSIARTATA